MLTETDRLNATFSALADPTRRAILARLSSGEASVSDLAKPMKMTMPAVTKHLKVLQRAGLIRQERRAQFRPCYLVAEPLKEAAHWVEQYRKFWEESLDRLDAYLKVLQAQNVAETLGQVNPAKTKKRKKNDPKRS
jgi:DNA-binding transcriptional ArsR family regulator